MSNLASIKSPYGVLEGLPRYESLVHMFRAAVNESPDVTEVICDDMQFD